MTHYVYGKLVDEVERRRRRLAAERNAAKDAADFVADIMATAARSRDETNASKLGRRIGLAMARDVVAEAMPRTWTGFDAQDGDELTAAGMKIGTDEWNEAEAAAKEAYLAVVGD